MDYKLKSTEKKKNKKKIERTIKKSRAKKLSSRSLIEPKHNYSDVFAAAKCGDVDYIQSWLGNGNDINCKI